MKYATVCAASWIATSLKPAARRRETSEAPQEAGERVAFSANSQRAASAAARATDGSIAAAGDGPTAVRQSVLTAVARASAAAAASAGGRPAASSVFATSDRKSSAWASVQ